MPRIRRWAKINLNLNRDPEVNELRDTYGDWMALVWLELLFVASHNDGEVPGKRDRIALDFAYISRRKRPSLSVKLIQNALDFMEESNWIEIKSDRILITKYAEYQENGDAKPTPNGNGKKRKTRQDKSRLDESTRKTPAGEDAETAPEADKDAPSERVTEGNRATWQAYSEAYFERYGTEPVRNAKVNAQVRYFVQRIGAEESPSVAAFYVQHGDAFYVRVGHSLDILLRDAEKLRTEWATNKRMGKLSPTQRLDDWREKDG